MQIWPTTRRRALNTLHTLPQHFNSMFSLIKTSQNSISIGTRIVQWINYSNNFFSLIRNNILTSHDRRSFITTNSKLTKQGYIQMRKKNKFNKYPFPTTYLESKYVHLAKYKAKQDIAPRMYTTLATCIWITSFLILLTCRWTILTYNNTKFLSVCKATNFTILFSRQK